MDKSTLEGIYLELDAALDNVRAADLDFEAFYERVGEVRDRVKFLLDNDPASK